MSGTLREDDTTKLEHMKPDFMKTDGEKLRHDTEDTADHIASHLPRQSLARGHVDSGAAEPHHPTHDIGRGGLGTMGDAFKPSGEQTLGQKVKVEGDKIGSHLESNEHKSTAQTLKDAITPGHDSSLTPHNHNTASTHTALGEKQGVLSKMVEVKDRVIDAVKGGAHAANDEPNTRATRKA